MFVGIYGLYMILMIGKLLLEVLATSCLFKPYK